MSKTLTEPQIRAIAENHAVEYAALRAVIEVEAGGSGFLKDGKPKILFEPHIFYRLLTQKRYITIRNNAMAQAGDICYPKWGQCPYGSVNAQHERLARAAEFDRTAALEACSWGMGQVMGYHWASLGYATLQDFINAMYRDEASQIDAMMRFIRANGLLGKLQRKDWVGFARGYNGAGYAKNAYDKKLAVAYRKYI